MESLLFELNIPILHARTKHIELNIHFVRKRIVAIKLQIQHALAHAQIAYVLTKLLPTNLFIGFRDKLKLLLSNHYELERKYWILD